MIDKRILVSYYFGTTKLTNQTKTNKKYKKELLENEKYLGTTADSNTASCSMRADSTSKGPEE